MEIENSSNSIGGPSLGDRNVISGNSGQRRWDLIPDQAQNPLNIKPTGNLIENNFIGTDASGRRRSATATEASTTPGTANTYGGTTAGFGNVISGNADAGLDASGSITIEGNFVGTDATGNVALGNGADPGLACRGSCQRGDHCDHHE